MKALLDAASGKEKADLVLKNAKVLNFFTKEIIEEDVAIKDDRIVGLGEYEGKIEIDCRGKYVSSSFIDCHMHLESTMVRALEFTKFALKDGTTSVFIDPHEIVNVLGLKGLDLIIKDCKNLPIDFRIMMPSSVPSSDYDHNGAGEVLAEDMKKYLENGEVFGLAEVMRVDDLINSEPKMTDKVNLFEDKFKDGHSPSLTGKNLQAYKLAGIDNDHEAENYEEGIERLRSGFKLFIREGSAARNLDSIVEGLVKNNISLENCTFCTDDKHLEDIETKGHISYCVKRSIELGVKPIEAYKMAAYNSARAYNLKNVGAVGAGYKADLLIISDLENVKIDEVIKNGKIVDFDELQERRQEEITDPEIIDTINIPEITLSDLKLKVDKNFPVMNLNDYSLVTGKSFEDLPNENGIFKPNSTFNKIVCIERYGRNPGMGIGVLKNFNLKSAAVATSISHDSHNVIAVSDNDEDLLLALEELKRIKGGYVLVSNGKVINSLSLEVAGIMTSKPGEFVKVRLREMIEEARKFGIGGNIDPFMTLSFLALTVIPELRITDSGVYDFFENKFY